MRHNKHHASLGVTREHRAAMLSNLAAALITRGRIQTTITKAKRAAAKTSKADALHLRRLALRDVRDEDAVTLLFNEKHKEFANRSGGYTRIYKLGPRRISDAAELALIEFVKAEDTGYKKSKGRKTAKARKAPEAGPSAGAAAPAEASAKPEASAESVAKPEASPKAEAPAGTPAKAEGPAEKPPGAPNP
jgi:large subunit ribosomal protein L17